MIPGKYLSLTTYRPDGSPVPTPVWFVEDGECLLVMTGADSYKAKRLRRNPACMVAPCNVQGELKGDGITAQVEFLPATEHARVEALMKRKYRADSVLILPLYRFVMTLLRKRVRRERAYLAIRPA